MGEKGEVVAVVSLTEDDVSLYGVVTGVTSEISTDSDKKGRTEYFVNVTMADGTAAKYLVEDDDYSDKAGLFCSVDFANGYAYLTFPNAVVKTGTVDKETKTFGGYKFASDYAILEYEDGNENEAVVTALTIADLDKTKLTRKDVKHVQLNMKGEIVVLYVNNASGNRDSYGIVVDVPDGRSGTYTILCGDRKYTKNGTYTSVSKGDCVAYYQGLEGSDMFIMTRVATGVSISGYTDNLIKMNGKTYTLADDVTVYAGKTVGELESVSLDDALELTGSIDFYSDRGVNEGGKVRVIRIIAR